MRILGLSERVRQRSEEAAGCAALASIPTRLHVLRERGVDFLIHLASLPHPPNTSATAPTHNPFLPYERALRVAGLGAKHVLLLNKFNVFEQHLLVVTRDFVDQQELLERLDFAVMAELMAELDGLAFFNAGPVAGASQRHKHLQLIPLPLGPDGVAPVPMLDALAAGGLGFEYHFARLRLEGTAPAEAADLLFEQYLGALAALGLLPEPGQRPLPYNLLFGRTWMAVVPRVTESASGISLNALAYAGSLFSNDASTLERLAKLGPFSLLRACGRGC